MSKPLPVLQFEAVTQAAFAKSVGLTRGRIAQLQHDGFPILPNGKVDLVAGRAWIAANVDQERSLRRKSAKRKPASASLADARRLKAQIDAEKAGLELDRMKGILIDRAVVERTIFGLARAERDAWQDWPLRVSAEMAAELRIDEAKLLPVLKRLVRDHLTHLSEKPLADLGR